MTVVGDSFVEQNGHAMAFQVNHLWGALEKWEKETLNPEERQFPKVIAFLSAAVATFRFYNQEPGQKPVGGFSATEEFEIVSNVFDRMGITPPFSTHPPEWPEKFLSTMLVIKETVTELYFAKGTCSLPKAHIETTIAFCSAAHEYFFSQLSGGSCFW